jgi:trans-aconitate methyltransferase
MNADSKDPLGMFPVDASYRDYDYDDDADSVSTCSGQSLATIITQHRYENGRRYHAFREGAYYQPNDQKAADWQMTFHHLFLLTFGDKLFLAPLNRPQKILDVGTGTGLWAIDMADIFPDADITATDLSPNESPMPPPNVRFEVDDCCSEWVYPENEFDYIHIRAMNGCVDDWQKLYQQCYRHLKPGGYLEHNEVGLKNVKNDPAAPLTRSEEMYAAHYENVSIAAELTGKTFRADVVMSSFIKEAGFVDVKETNYKWPVGPWCSDARLKEIGRWAQRMWMEGMEGFVLALFTRQLGWSPARVQNWIEDMKWVIRDRDYHCWQPVRCIVGRKPFPGEVVIGSAAMDSSI